jgi:hypothetical protein
MAHARRKFFDAFEATKSPLAKAALDKIAGLYLIERDIRGSPPDERLRVRTERRAALFAELKAWLETTLSQVSGRGEKAKQSATRCQAVSVGASIELTRGRRHRRFAPVDSHYCHQRRPAPAGRQGQAARGLHRRQCACQKSRSTRTASTVGA